MKILKYLTPLLLVIVAAPLFAQRGQETSFNRELNTRDDQPLREFVQSKENIDLKEKSKNLEISGDVRFEWRSIREKGLVFTERGYSDDYIYEDNDDAVDAKNVRQKFRNIRGGNRVNHENIPISTNDFDVEFNLKFKYRFKDAWAMAHLQFDNPAGIRGKDRCHGHVPVYNKEGDEVVGVLPGDFRRTLKGSGAGNLFNLKRAYMGYNILADGTQRLDIEIGRQKLNDIFDSEIEFTARFDGILLKYARSFEELFDWYVNAGAFVIDESVNHFGYAAEIGFIDILDTGFDVRYNFIDWKKRGKNRCFILNPLGAEYQNSQITLTYTFSPCIFRQELPIELYGGFLVNHAARKTVFSRNKKKNLGWFAGAYIGNVSKKGDWALDIEYILVQAQAVPEYDVGSIGRGNILNEDMFDIVDEKDRNSSSSNNPSRHVDAFFPRRGNSNFAGWRFEFLYAITDNFTIDTVFEFSNAEDRKIGGRHRYSDFEIEAIYAF